MAEPDAPKPQAPDELGFERVIYEKSLRARRKHSPCCIVKVFKTRNRVGIIEQHFQRFAD